MTSQPRITSAVAAPAVILALSFNVVRRSIVRFRPLHAWPRRNVASAGAGPHQNRESKGEGRGGADKMAGARAHGEKEIKGGPAHLLPGMKVRRSRPCRTPVSVGAVTEKKARAVPVSPGWPSTATDDTGRRSAPVCGAIWRRCGAGRSIWRRTDRDAAASRRPRGVVRPPK